MWKQEIADSPELVWGSVVVWIVVALYLGLFKIHMIRQQRSRPDTDPISDTASQGQSEGSEPRNLSEPTGEHLSDIRARS